MRLTSSIVTIRQVSIRPPSAWVSKPPCRNRYRVLPFPVEPLAEGVPFAHQMSSMNHFMRAVAVAVIAAGTTGAVVGTPEEGPGSVSQAEELACLSDELARIPPAGDVPLASGAAGCDEEVRLPSEPPGGSSEEPTVSDDRGGGAVAGVARDFGECQGTVPGSRVDITFSELFEGRVTERCAKPRPLCSRAVGGGSYNQATGETTYNATVDYEWASVFEGETIRISVAIESEFLPEPPGSFTVDAVRAKDINAPYPDPGSGIVRVLFSDGTIYETESGTLEVTAGEVTIDALLAPIQGVTEEDYLVMTGTWNSPDLDYCGIG